MTFSGKVFLRVFSFSRERQVFFVAQFFIQSCHDTAWVFPLLLSHLRNQQNAVTVPPSSCYSVPRPQKALRINITKILAQITPEPPGDSKCSGSDRLGEGARRVRNKARPSRLCSYSRSLSHTTLTELSSAGFAPLNPFSHLMACSDTVSALMDTTDGTFLFQSKVENWRAKPVSQHCPVNAILGILDARLIPVASVGN